MLCQWHYGYYWTLYSCTLNMCQTSTLYTVHLQCVRCTLTNTAHLFTIRGTVHGLLKWQSSFVVSPYFSRCSWVWATSCNVLLVQIIYFLSVGFSTLSTLIGLPTTTALVSDSVAAQPGPEKSFAVEALAQIRGTSSTCLYSWVEEGFRTGQTNQPLQT